MHAKFFGCFALIAFVLGENLEQVTALELPDRVVVGDAGIVHVRDQSIQFALQVSLPRRAGGAASQLPGTPMATCCGAFCVP